MILVFLYFLLCLFGVGGQCHENQKSGAGEMAQQLSELAALAEDQSLDPAP